MRNRFFIASFVLLLLLLAGRSYQNYRFVESKLLARYTTLQQNAGFVSASAFQTFILQGFTELERLAADPNVIALNQRGKEQMASFQESLPNLIGNITRLDREMRIEYTYPPEPRVLGTSVAYQEHNRKLLATHQPVMGRPFVAVQGYEALPLVQPVFRNGVFDGTVSILFRSSWLRDVFWRPLQSLSSDSFVGLADSDGSIFWRTESRSARTSVTEDVEHSDLERLRKDLEDASLTGSTTYRGPVLGYSGRWLVGVVPLTIKDKKWFLLSGVPDEPLAHVLANYRFNLLVVILLVTLLVMVLVFALFSYRRQYSLAKVRARDADAFEAALEERTRDLAAAKQELERYSLDLEVQIAEKTRKVKEREEMYRLLLDNVTASIFILARSRFTYVNPGFLMSTRTPQNDASYWIGKYVLELVSEGSRQGMVAALDTLEAGAPVVEVADLEVVNLRGETEVWEGSLRRAKIGNRELTMGFFRDITERKRLEHQMLQVQKLESVGRLAGGVAHDFNNILGGMFGNLALLRQHLSDDARAEVQELVRTIEVSARRAADLTKKLLVFSRRGDEERHPMSISKMLEEVDALIRTSLPASVKFNLRIPEGDSLNVLANPTEIQQVLLNLCINGIEAMPKGGSLTVTAERSRGDGDGSVSDGGSGSEESVVVRVRDTGTGIDPKLLDRIFDPFFTTKEPGKGSGLGLSIAHHLVVKHGGRMLVDSDWGRGSVFTLHLPAYLKELREVTEGVEFEYPDFSGAPAVLMVDDEETICGTAKAFFADKGLTIHTATDGASGIECFKNRQDEIGLVLMDLRMPRMNGVEAFAFIRKLKPDVPGVLMTGFGYDRPTEDFTTVGFAEVIAKPFSFEELAELFARYLLR